MAFYLLQTMPKSYDQLVTVLETLSTEQYTLDFVKAHIVERERDTATSQMCFGYGFSRELGYKSESTTEA